MSEAKLPTGPDTTEYFRERCAQLERLLRVLLKARQASHMKALIKEALK